MFKKNPSYTTCTTEPQDSSNKHISSIISTYANSLAVIIITVIFFSFCSPPSCQATLLEDQPGRHRHRRCRTAHWVLQAKPDEAGYKWRMHWPQHQSFRRAQRFEDCDQSGGVLGSTSLQLVDVRVLGGWSVPARLGGCLIIVRWIHLPPSRRQRCTQPWSIIFSFFLKQILIRGVASCLAGDEQKL